MTLKEATESMIGPLPPIPFPKTPGPEYRGWAEDLLAEAKQHNAVSLQVKDGFVRAQLQKGTLVDAQSDVEKLFY